MLQRGVSVQMHLPPQLWSLLRPKKGCLMIVILYHGAADADEASRPRASILWALFYTPQVLI